MNTAAFSVSTVNTVMTKLAVDAAALSKAMRAAVNSGTMLRMPRNIDPAGNFSPREALAVESRGVKLLGRIRAVSPRQPHVVFSALGGVPPRTLDSPTRKFVNLAVARHEIAEAGKHHGIFPFQPNAMQRHDVSGGTHLSLSPLLSDLNIAATATGPGAATTANILRAVRRKEIQQLSSVIPETQRLGLGSTRISRHANKRLQELFDRRSTVAAGETFDAELARKYMRAVQPSQLTRRAPSHAESIRMQDARRAAEELAFRNKMDELLALGDKMDELLGQYNPSRQELGLDELARPDYDTLHVAPIKSPTTW